MDFGELAVYGAGHNNGTTVAWRTYLVVMTVTDMHGVDDASHSTAPHQQRTYVRQTYVRSVVILLCVAVCNREEPGVCRDGLTIYV